MLCILLETQLLESIKDKICKLPESNTLGLNSDLLFDVCNILQNGPLAQK